MPQRQRRLEEKLSRRERQIMDILFETGQATAEEIRERLPEPPSNSAVRAMLSRLETKGMIRHDAIDLRYVYTPTLSRNRVRRSAIRRLVDVFFEGSVAKTVTALLELSEGELSDGERERLELLIRRQRTDGKESSHD